MLKRKIGMEEFIMRIYQDQLLIFNVLYVELYFPLMRIENNTEKEAHGELHEDTIPEEMEIAKEQEELDESSASSVTKHSVSQTTRN
jgi:hypothetical protein